MNHSLLRVPILAFVLLYITGCSLIVDSAIEDIKEHNNQQSDYYVSFDFNGEHFSRFFKNKETFLLSYYVDNSHYDGDFIIGKFRYKTLLRNEEGIRIIRDNEEDIFLDFSIRSSNPFQVGEPYYFDNETVTFFSFLSLLDKKTETVNGSFSIESMNDDSGVIKMCFEFEMTERDGSIISVKNGELYAHLKVSDEVKDVLGE